MNKDYVLDLIKKNADSESNRKERRKKQEYFLQVFDIMNGCVDNLFQEDREWQEEIIKSYFKAFPGSYRQDSEMARAQGLYLWDCLNCEGMRTSEAFVKLREVVPMDKNGAPDDKVLFRWLRKTEECVNNGKVMSLGR